MADKRLELMQIVGVDNLFDDSATLDIYSKDNSFVPSRRPKMVVRPSDSAQVQSIIRWANKTATTLIPVSSGPPHFRGDTVPTVAGAVVVDLSRMKRLLSVDRRNRIVIIEPGLTYDELQAKLTKEGLSLSRPLLPRRSKSVLSSLLEREPMITPKYQWTLMEPLRCLGLIWGDGSKMSTGEAGGYTSENIKEQQKKHRSFVVGMGPNNVDFYRLVSAAQGTMGIITWASVKCELLPSIRKLYFVPSNDLQKLIDCAYKILRVRFGDELFILNSANLASVISSASDQIKSLSSQLPHWVLMIGIAGRDYLPRERIAFQEKDIFEFVHQSGLEMTTTMHRVEGNELLEKLYNPSTEPYWKLRYKGGCQDIFFITNLNETPKFMTTMHSTAQAFKYPETDIGVYIQPLHQGVCCHCEFNLPYDPDNGEELTWAQKLFAKASEQILFSGGFFSRPYGIWADMAYNRDAAATIMLKKVKSLFDPNNVMNSGKLCF
ncbi:MAG: FAD-binding oxidoreductase [Desulfobacteraceae bacterium]|nr:MAG: FAD-binding oxidoreductase [Desulfobacteraceae bacterium]